MELTTVGYFQPGFLTPDKIIEYTVFEGQLEGHGATNFTMKSDVLVKVSRVHA